MFNFSLPSNQISHLVERIYEVDIPRASTFAENRLIPMGTGTITFVLKGNPRVECIEGIQSFPNFALSGQYFPTFSFDSDIPLLHYGIALRPTASSKLFNIHLSDIKNNFIPMDEIIGDKASRIRQNLLQVNSTKERFDLLNECLLQQLPVSKKYTHLDVLVDFIYQKKGILKVTDLCEHANVSRRYLEKRFKKVMGFTPGQYIRQIRFHYTCAEIAEEKNPPNDILIKFGFYDRSHFMKKFKKYYGKDLSVLTGNNDSLFKSIFSQILRTDTESSYHP